MNNLKLSATELAGNASMPLLVVLPSLGTSVAALWTPVAERLAHRFHVVGVDLPGHGQSAPATGPFRMPDLAQAVLAAVELFSRDQFRIAGVSIGGCITQQLTVDAPQRLAKAVILNSAAKIGQAEAWDQRAALVLAEDTAVLREGSAARWFAPGFAERDGKRADALLASLCEADAASYAGLCRALAQFDLRYQLGDITVPMLVIGGKDDVATPPEQQIALAAGFRDGRVHIVPQVGHLAPAEQPDQVEELIAAFLD
ncbi:alpha/beta fold hydrolase [Paracoccus sp. MBLB3053]|uniref:Alpha/beta fold hydrolase n=1 Tax=Paracoccus aurantius TaxID=3073814 RepID=A0ABU2HZF7_9RHOB|nr:alpha/beta fold hydrolase [Paracoccus sp. MBLB3053]MDS9469684.1 alpha/beta fold hydrolase [Paracoccus sp. MBLB3053]